MCAISPRNLLLCVQAVLCPRLIPSNVSLIEDTSEDQWYHILWGMDSTVPIVLIPLLLPLISCRSAVFFTKFNSLGKLYTYCTI